jgi:prepilin-type N-terminal cleavage/methylation domain-containing protein
MHNKPRSEQGFSLLEVLFAMTVLTVGVLGAAGVLAAGMQNLSSSPADVVVTQKAAEAVEAVFSARDSHKLTWAQIKNTADGGIFVGGAQPLKLPGADGLVNTAADSGPPVEVVTLPGEDPTLGTSDDTKTVYNSFTREIKITDITGTNGELRKIEVTVTYQNGPTKRTYRLTTYISAYS